MSKDEEFEIRDHRQPVCADCGTSKGPFHKHHIILLSDGGPDIPENMALLCQECHQFYHSAGLVYFDNEGARRALKRRDELTSQMRFVGHQGLMQLLYEEGYLPLFERMVITPELADNMRFYGWEVPEEIVGQQYNSDFLKGLRSPCR